ncbi:MAG TPA: flavin-dependent oxidoreductase [Allosphingosinicella sp.]|jgi:2-polyprenyl-6-methoxyphenol hydroxylase-like FAD-dependent oxidoreductase
MTEKRFEVAIVGAGIAGLSLALRLHAKGIASRIFEQAPRFSEMGVGITVLPHAMRELDELGVQEAVVGAGIENRHSSFFNRFGQLIYSEPRGLLAGYAHQEVGIHRAKLQLALLAAVVERLGPDAVLTDHRLADVEQDEAQVTLHFVDGAGTPRPPVKADIAIACDGINSAVRRSFYPTEQVAFAGINTWRGVTRRAPILDGRTYMRLGSIRTGKMVIYPIRNEPDGRQLINWIAEIEDPVLGRNDWNAPGRPEQLLPIFGGWRFDWLDVAELIGQADAILEYPMVDKDPVDQWTFGRITFAGDAAHPMYPRGSNGAAQALIDTRVLAEKLGGAADPSGALRAYEEERRPATAAVVRANRASPPDIINIRVEELTGDAPFEDLDALISQEELRDLSEQYKRVAGFTLDQRPAGAALSDS